MPPPLFEVTELEVAVFDQDVAGAAPDPHAPPLFDVSGERLGQGWVRAVHGVDYGVAPGEVLAMVGESASGKSLALMGAFHLLSAGARVVGGSARYRGFELSNPLPEARPRRLPWRRRRRRFMEELDDPEWRRIVGREIGFLFQDPIAAWEPLSVIGEQTGEVLEVHDGLTQEEITDRVVDALGEVRLDGWHRFSFRHELSRGQAQRAMLAAALIKAPRLLIADEPLSGLDPPVAAAILDLMRDLKRRRDMAMILVTHDLATVASIADRVAVVYGGRIVEQGPVRQIFRSPTHPYTAGLLASVPRPGRRLRPIRGEAPLITRLPAGCAFAARCDYATEICFSHRPSPETSGATTVACHHWARIDLEGIGG